MTIKGGAVVKYTSNFFQQIAKVWLRHRLRNAENVQRIAIKKKEQLFNVEETIEIVTELAESKFDCNISQIRGKIAVFSFTDLMSSPVLSYIEKQMTLFISKNTVYVWTLPRSFKSFVTRNETDTLITNRVDYLPNSIQSH